MGLSLEFFFWFCHDGFVGFFGLVLSWEFCWFCLDGIVGFVLRVWLVLS